MILPEYRYQQQVAEMLESEPKLQGTGESPLQIDGTCTAGTAKYNKGRRLARDKMYSEVTSEDLELQEPDPEDEGDGGSVGYAWFGKVIIT